MNEKSINATISSCLVSTIFQDETNNVDKAYSLQVFLDYKTSGSVRMHKLNAAQNSYDNQIVLIVNWSYS